MRRFYKVRIHCGDAQKQDYETFIIYPSKNNFDSFMTEICARLPELFYQPFKLYYQDATGEFVTIFNWLDFGVFFMQYIDKVYIIKGDSTTNLHYRTLWSMPMPTAPHFAAYEQFMGQPAHQLSQPTCFDFIRNADNTIPGSHLPATAPSQNPGGQSVANAPLNAGTQQSGPLFDFAEAAQQKTNQNFSFNAVHGNHIADLLQNIPPATKISAGPTPNAAGIATVNADASAATDTKLNCIKSDTTAGDNQNPKGDNVNNLIAAIESHRKIVENNIHKLLDQPDEPLNASNPIQSVIHSSAKVLSVSKKKKGKNASKQQGQVKIQVVEPAVFIGEPILNHSFSLGDEVEVCSGDWEFLQGKITEIDGDMIKISGGIKNGNLAIPLTFKANDLRKYSKPETHANPIKPESGSIVQEVSSCDRSSESDDKILKENENAVIKTDETVVALKEEVVLNEDSTKLPIAVKSEATNNIIFEKNAVNVPNKNVGEAIIDFTGKKQDEICDSVKLINIEDTECSTKSDGNNNDEKPISIETGQESPTNREWAFVETAEYAEPPATAVDTGTIPKKTVSTQDLDNGNIKRRTLPKIPIMNTGPAAVAPAGQTTEGLIDETLIIMIGMGFSNEGDQLRRLIESVDGNISSALDLLDSQK